MLVAPNQTDMGPLQPPTLLRVIITAFFLEKAHLLSTIVLCDSLTKPTSIIFPRCFSSSHSLRSVIFHSWLCLQVCVCEQSAGACPEPLETLSHSEFNQTALDYLRGASGGCWELVSVDALLRGNQSANPMEMTESMLCASVCADGCVCPWICHIMTIKILILLAK